MNNAPKILVPIALLFAAAVGLILLMKDPVQEPPPPGGQQVQDNTGTETQTEQPPTAAAAHQRTENPPTTDNVRVAVDSATDRSGQEHAQGVTGRVLSPNGDIVEGAMVYLMQSASSDPFRVFLANKTGEVIPPVAMMATDTGGQFQLGVAEAGKVFDLRVVCDTYPDLQHKNIRILTDGYYDAGDLLLEFGVVVQGQVTLEGTGIAVPGAQVSVQSVNELHSVLPTPGREKGLSAIADQNGFYRIPNASAASTVNIAAEAPEYARVEKKNVRLEAGSINDVNFELPRGMPIVGYVFSADRKAITAARVVANALSSKTPQTGQANTDQDGRFEIPGLRDGPYQVTVTANNYNQRTEKPIFAGAQDVTITLESMGLARVKVLAAKGTPILGYKLSLKRHFPNNPIGIGNVPDVPDRRIGPGDHRDGWAEVAGLPLGTFVFQIEARKHAKTLSDPFTINAGGETPDVIVNMTLGGAITGRVLDDRGNPVVGATVASDMAGGLAADTEFGEIFKAFMPDRVTKTSDKTDGNGRFRLPTLAYGDYLIKVAHRDFCEGVQQNITVANDNPIEIGDVYLQRGAVVYGRATVNGSPSGQVKVQVSPPSGTKPELDAAGRPKMWFSARSISRNDGSFRFLKRVPPGNYEIFASKPTGDNNPFTALLHVRQTKRDLQVLPGQDAIEINFDISQ